jgi:hypothetical protein
MSEANSTSSSYFAANHKLSEEVAKELADYNSAANVVSATVAAFNASPTNFYSALITVW